MSVVCASCFTRSCRCEDVPEPLIGHRRLDLMHYAGPYADDLYHVPDVGAFVRMRDTPARRGGWWATNDQRWAGVGNLEATAMVQPTVGPFATLREAHAAYEQAAEQKERS